MNNNTISADRLSAEISEYFSDFFGGMSFESDLATGTLKFTGNKAGVLIHHEFDVVQWQDIYLKDMEHHALENLKGQFTQSLLKNTNNERYTCIS